MLFERFSAACAASVGLPITFAFIVAINAAWLASGFVFSWSDDWHLVGDIALTQLPVLLLFLLQNTQNRDTKALQAKLDELISATGGARNTMMRAEDMDADEIEEERLDPNRY